MLKSNDLSDRERDILKLVATGVSNKEIARELHISTNTVKVHLRNIFAKINVYSRTEATLYAIEHGIVDTPGNQEVQDGSNAFKKETIYSRRRWIYLSVIALIILTTSYVTWFSLQSKKNSPPAPLSSIATPTNQPRWQKHAPLPEGRAGMAAAVYENQIYLFAGETKNGITNTALKYDIETDQWHSITDKPTPVTDIQAAMIGEKIYIPGGWTGNEAIQKMEVYDPRSDSWEEKASIPKARSGYALTSLEGKLFLFGGSDGENVTDNVYSYNPTYNEWTEMRPMLVPGAFINAVSSGTKIYLIGGWNGNQALTRTVSYIPARDLSGDNPWIELLPLPQPLCFHAAVELINSIYVIGEINSRCNIQNDVRKQKIIYQYQILNNRWVDFEENSTVINYNFSLVGISNMIYYIGGYEDKTLSRQNLSYIPIYLSTLPLIINPH